MADSKMEGTEVIDEPAAGSSSTAPRNEEFSLNVTADDETSTFDRSFLDDIARQQAEIINGFPLASLGGVADGELGPLSCVARF